MEDKKIPVNFDVQVYGDLVPYSNTISKARVRIFYRGLNRNYSYISDEFADKLISSLPYTPVKAIYDEDANDFTDHGNGAKSLSKAYGVVPENGNGAWERHIDNDGVERTYYCTDVLLWTTLYENAKKIPGKCQSMELDEHSIKGEWTVFDNGSYGFKFTEGCFLGLQVLGSIEGEKVEPCFEGSAFYTLKEQFSEIIDIAKNYNLKKEDASMEDNKVTTNASLETEATVESQVAENSVIEESTVEPTIEATETTTEATVETSIETTDIGAEIISTAPESYTEKTEEVQTVDYETKYTELTERHNELNKKFVELSDKFSVLTDEFNHLKIERDNLKEYKDNAEKAEKENIIAKYSVTLPETVLAEYKNKMAEYSALELDKELCFEAHKNDNLEPQTANFTYKNNEFEEMSALEKCLSNYKIEN